MTDTIQLRKSLVVRFRKIRGQIQGIQRMIEHKRRPDVLIQLSAAKSALDRASLLVLENHMRSCLLRADSVQSLEEQKENLIVFIRNYKYGNTSMPYIPSDMDVLLQEAISRISDVIQTIEEFEENRCSDVLRRTSEIRDLLTRIGLLLFNQEIEESLIADQDEQHSSLQDILDMAKKFII